MESEGDGIEKKNILSNHSFVGDRVKADCNLVALQALTTDGNKPLYRTIGESIWATLAIQHLNDGDGVYISEVDLLNKRCGINFNLKFIDTQASIAIAMTKLVDRLDFKTNPDYTPPCGFIGASYLTVSQSTSTLTNLNGYVQISGSSTSSYLDSPLIHPYFARTIPSNDASAKAFVSFLKKQKIKHFTVVYMEDSYGLNIVDELRKHALQEDIEIKPIAVYSDLSNIVHSIQVLKSTPFNYILCSLFFEQLEDGVFIMEAITQDVVHDRQWFLAEDNYGSLFQWTPGLDEKSQFVEFFNNTGRFAYKTEIQDDDLNIYESGMEGILNDNSKYSIKSMLPPTINMNWTQFARDSLFYYEAVIMLGLSACNAAKINLNVSSFNNTNGYLYLDTSVLYKKLINMDMSSKITGDVIRLNNRTGTREPATAHFVMSNMVIPYYGEENNTNTSISMKLIKTDDYFDGAWKSFDPFIYKNGSTIPMSDLQPVNEQPIFFSKIVLGISYLLFILTVMLAIGFSSWTMINKKTKIVNASQPFFLYMICFGVIIFAFGIIPSATELQHHSNLTDNENFCMTISCTSCLWFWFIGSAIVSSSLLGKAYRIHTIMNSAMLFKRVKVTVQDTLIPISVILMLNIILLSLMTGIHPIQYTLDEESSVFDEFDRPVETTMYCTWTKDQLWYIIPLFVLDGCVLCLAIYYIYLCRDLSTEYQESEHIFRALVSILLILLFAVPIWFIAKQDVNAVLYVISGITFVSSWSLLLLIFFPKILYEKNRKAAIVDISVIPPIHAVAAIAIFEGADDDDGNYEGNDEDDDTNGIGDTILSTETSGALIKSNQTFRQRYRAKKVELQTKEVELQTKEAELQAMAAELKAHISTIKDLRRKNDTSP